MYRLACIFASAALLTATDVSHLLTVPQQNTAQQQIPASETIPVLPSFGAAQGNSQDAGPAAGNPSSPPAAASQDDAAAQPADPASVGNITETSRMEIIRNVSGEFARMRVSLPGGKRGFRIRAGEPLDQESLKSAIRSSGAALNAGDNVQITKVDFQGDAILLEINGGPSGGVSWRNRVHMTMADGTPSSSVNTEDQSAPTDTPVAGASLFLDFGRALPDMSSVEIKRYVAAIFDFSGQRSASSEWIESLPPEIRQAIEDKRAALGMDQEEVLAALGRPDRKVREQNPDGVDTEDWIYGRPPLRTVFVLFAGEKVIKVNEY